MKFDNALSNCASAPFKKTNLEPDVFDAKSKSIKFNFAPIS